MERVGGVMIFSCNSDQMGASKFPVSHGILGRSPNGRTPKKSTLKQPGALSWPDMVQKCFLTGPQKNQEYNPKGTTQKPQKCMSYSQHDGWKGHIQDGHMVP